MEDSNNPYPNAYPRCKECMGRGKIMHQGSLVEEPCEKCSGRGYITDPLGMSTATPGAGG